jgi:type IV pilus assembly protein PilZ
METPDTPEDGVFSLQEDSFLDPIEAVRRMRREREFDEVSPVIISLGLSIPRSRSEKDLSPKGRAPGVENRQHPRHKSDFMVQATLLATEGTIDGTCKDLSLGGAFIQMEPPLPRGTKFQLLIRLKTIESTLYTAAEVVWARSDGMGVRFLDLDIEKLRVLESALQDLPAVSASP